MELRHAMHVLRTFVTEHDAQLTMHTHAVPLGNMLPRHSIPVTVLVDANVNVVTDKVVEVDVAAVVVMVVEVGI